MWLYDYKDSEKNNPYKESPFVAITHMSYVDNLPKGPILARTSGFL